MEDYSIGVVESKFADIVWSNAPLATSELVKICEKELEWKRTTTYTVLKKLSDRGLFVNDGGTVKVCMTKEEFYARQSESYVENSFSGSLPGFLAAFTSRKKLSDKEIKEIMQIIEDNK
ncbi:MAG: BlaI/MecI/CopY family transcriptional regulator [Lachnospiraceae bacterium]|nr:BlaI/MecI/CopY family transcriptional regulator [Lachnospiraceae bacterium]